MFPLILFLAEQNFSIGRTFCPPEQKHFIQDLYSTHKKLWTFNYNVLFIFDLTLD